MCLPDSQRRQPARGLEQALPGPVGQLLVRPAPLLGIPFRGRQHGQERQRPHAPRPGDRGQERQRHPAQPACLDEVAMAGAHGVAIDPAGRDALTPASFQRVIHPDHHRPGWREGGDQHSEQHPRCGASRPVRLVQHTVIAGEPWAAILTGRAQGGADRASMQSKQSALDQHRHPAPSRPGKQASERHEPGREKLRCG